jgi:cytochrome P450 enzyme
MNNMSATTIAKLVAYLAHGAITKPGFSKFKPGKYKVFYKDPNPTWDAILEEKRVFFCPSMASWCVAGYDNVKTALLDPRLTTNFNRWKFAPVQTNSSDWDKVTNSLLFTLDKDSHARIRRLTNPAFGPRTIANIQRITDEIVDNVLKDIQPGTVVDVADKIANVVPRAVVAELVGVKEQDHARFESLTSAVLTLFDPRVKTDHVAAQAGVDLMLEYIEERRQNPTDDFISQLINHVEDGDRINAWEAIGLIASLIAAGPETVGDAILFGLYNILLNPGTLEELKANPDLIENAVKEGERWNHFGYSAPIRFALEDITIDGNLIKKGEMIRLLQPTANRDPAVFANPGIYDIHRENLDKSLRFGAGPHFCAGFAIANTITFTTIRKFLQKFPEFSMTEEPHYIKHVTTRRLTRFPLKLEAQTVDAGDKLQAVA